MENLVSSLSVSHISTSFMLNISVKARAVEAGAATRYGSGFTEMMRLLANSVPQYCFQ
jgi:hypothetical protein